MLSKILKFIKLHKKIFSSFIIWFIILLGVFWAGKGLFKYQFYSTHDLDHHLARSYDAIQTFAEGQFPLRFAGTLNYGCGVPIFTFFYPLLYYLAVMIYPIFKDMFMVFKVVSFAALLIGTAFFFLWAKKETGDKLAALAGSILYLYAPYRFILVYVRGDPEYLAYAIWPVVLFFYSLAFKEKNFRKFLWYVFFAALTGGLLAISHNFVAMFLLPVLLIYLILKFFFGERLERKRIYLIILAFVSAFGLGAFFIFPALFEKSLTQLNGPPTFTYYDHFPELWQVIRSKWGYFYSFPGTKDDGMSFQLGYAHWVVLGMVTSWLIFHFGRLIVRGKSFVKFLTENIWIISSYILSIFFLFLTLPYSRSIWDKLPLLQAIQFPWRLLGVDVLAISTLFVFWVVKINKKVVYWVLLIFIAALAFAGTRNDLLAEPVIADTVTYYAHPESNPLRYSLGSVGNDVLPKDMVGTCYFTDKFVRTGLDTNVGGLDNKVIDKKSTGGSVEFSVDEKTLSHNRNIIFDLSYFPGVFRFNINGIPKDYKECRGFVCFPSTDFKSGQNFVDWKVSQTPIETAFNYLTLAFLILWLVILIGLRRIKPLLPLIVIFLIFIFFRTYNLPQRVGFGWDQERDANAAMGILTGHFTLIGPRVQSSTGFFLPPYFFYLMAPFYAITGGNPTATLLLIGFWSVVFFAVSYFVISKIFSKKTALIFLALWAVSPLATAIDTIAWNPIVIPLAFIVLIYFAYRYFKHHKKLDLFLIGLTFGFGVSFHTQFIFTFLFLLPVLYDVLKNKRFSGLIGLITGFVLPFTPIFLFDLRHNFLNMKLALDFLKNQNPLVRVFPVWNNFASFMFGVISSYILGIAVFVFIALILLWLVKTTKEQICRKLFIGLASTWIFSLPLFFVFAKNPSEYYFNFLLVIVILSISYFFSTKRILGIIFSAVLILIFIVGSNPLLNHARYNLEQKENAVMFLKNITDKEEPFNVSFNVPANEDAGFRYLLDYYRVKYSGDPKNPLIQFVIPSNKLPTPFVFGDVSIYLPPGWIKDSVLK